MKTVQEYLQWEFTRRRSRNPQYSQRAFARHLKLSSGEISEVLRGKRALSAKAGIKIAKALDLNPAERRHLLNLIQKIEDRDLPRSAPSERRISEEEFAFLSHWYSLAIVSLSKCDGFQLEEKWIARRLGISLLEAQVALRQLERVGLLKIENGNSSFTQDYILSPDEIPSAVIRQYHRAVLEKAIQALETQSVEERQIVGIGIALDPLDLPNLKKDVHRFLDEVSSKYGRARRKKEVYQCEIALFQLTKGDGR